MISSFLQPLFQAPFSHIPDRNFPFPILAFTEPIDRLPSFKFPYPVYAVYERLSIGVESANVFSPPKEGTPVFPNAKSFT